MTKLPQNLLHSEPGPRTDGLKDTLSLRLNPLFAHILTPPTTATMPAQTWHPFTFFQPGILPQRCYQVATALTLSRRSQQREGEALPLLHALTIAHAPDKVNRQQVQAVCKRCSHMTGYSQLMELRLRLKSFGASS